VVVCVLLLPVEHSAEGSVCVCVLLLPDEHSAEGKLLSVCCCCLMSTVRREM
jgi:hypothetical protein